MRTVDDLLQQATSDLAKAQQREARARDAVETAAAERARLESFLAVLTAYVQPQSAAASFLPAPSKGGRESKHGTISINLLRQQGTPMQIDPLADAVEATGFEIGGGDRRNAYLASYLSKDPRLMFIRGRGWWATELGPVPSVDASDPSEDTEPSGNESPEGSSVVGLRANGPTSLPDLRTYRMGGGGT